MGATNWSALTRMPVKAYHYELDTCFREGQDEVQEAFGDRQEEVLHRSALMLVKPDGMATGKLGVIRDFLGTHNFSIIGAELFRFNRHTGRELWRHQHTLASLDRLAVNDIVLQAGPTLLLLLRRFGDHPEPATVHLSSLKGKADMSQQTPDSLRGVLQRPNRLCSMIHCADEPADLVRELNLLMDPAPRHRLLGRLREGVSSPADEDLLDHVLHSGEFGNVTLDRDGAVRRIRHTVRERATEHPDLAAAAGRIEAWLEGTERGELLPWREFTRVLKSLDIKVDVWDMAIVGSSHIVEDEPGAIKVIGNPRSGSWLA
ncbi:nucleoside-diphosphate kinase [Streptomyces sp. PTM05]|uniref:Nucleoside-diphosphate kinase n=1 Tax=Streptantibioticus parmotrematis TaxID=2873249 RepID=A0ABS7QNH9_9ACTN|nr:nucleoside-diphosphate kinase [Streptantibioticus parmotrematis]MBY8884735.1 nucleoside-diphosphate kinase [Streptantibioticus parmotrematis]